MSREPKAPFRWDLLTPDQLGTLLAAIPPADLWYRDELVRCAARVLARSADGRIIFVGRSADSIFDLLSGALSNDARCDRLARLPFSFRGDSTTLMPPEIDEARALFTATGIVPDDLPHAPRPTVFVDLVYRGHTFTNLYQLIRAWADDRNVRWASIRTRIRFIGITIRTHTSPKTWRWWQHVDWTRELPARSVVNVSLDHRVWCYLGNDQPKLTRSFSPERWLESSPDGPRHDIGTRHALAEAVALVALGRSPEGRGALRAALAREPTYADRWLRALATELR
ncbi:hypothetical protein [Sandaracinus amylolyticus]|uniref:hypothetical protein n=1 Tax=Sandaracinus amylolyticus TaxID=927083 RepID=UPI001F38F159|nr:hypothetical protein [Sandaracinus amylolyticus]UJR83207.1 Hypothetical protein I5071_52730 [Sandaracinus amylolyticus]